MRTVRHFAPNLYDIPSPYLVKHSVGKQRKHGVTRSKTKNVSKNNPLGQFK